MDNDMWAPLNEFEISITSLTDSHVNIDSAKYKEGETLKHTQIRETFGSTHVKVLDDDYWPSNEAGLQVRHGTSHGILFAVWAERWKKNGIKAKKAAAVMVFKAVWSVLS